MSTIDLIDPEFRPMLDAMPPLSITKEALPIIRQKMSETWELVEAEEQGVVREEILIPGFNKSDHDVRCLLYKPKQVDGPIGAYLHIHGGGYMLGAPDMADGRNVELSSTLGIVVLSVDYRLAPEHPAPRNWMTALLHYRGFMKMLKNLASAQTMLQSVVKVPGEGWPRHFHYERRKQMSIKSAFKA